MGKKQELSLNQSEENEYDEDEIIDEVFGQIAKELKDAEIVGL